MPAVISSLFSSITAVARGKANKRRQTTSRYFNRPKFLQAPDPSTLAPPPWNSRPRHNARPRPRTETTLRESSSSSDSSSRPSESRNSPPSSPFRPSPGPVRGWGRDAVGESNAPTHRRPPDTNGQLPFPSPISPAANTRVEPEFAPRSEMGGMSEVDGLLKDASAGGCASGCVAPLLLNEGPSSILVPATSESSDLDGGQLWPNSNSNYDEDAENRPVVQRKVSADRSLRHRISFEEHLACQRRSLALAGWASDLIYAQVTRGCNARQSSQCHSQPFSVYIRRIAAKHIYSILLSSSVDSAVVFYAVLLVTRIPVDLIDSAGPSSQHLRQPTTEEIIVRAFLVGLMLASKWIEDSTFGAKQWHQVSIFSLELINSMERAALTYLGYDIGINASNWHRWLVALRNYHNSVAGYDWTENSAWAYALVRDEIEANLVCCEVLGTYNSGIPVFPWKLDLYDVPAGEHHAGERRVLQDIDVPMPGTFPQERLPVASPSPTWCPSADPIIPRPPRPACQAPGACVSRDSAGYRRSQIGGSSYPRELGYTADV